MISSLGLNQLFKVRSESALNQLLEFCSLLSQVLNTEIGADVSVKAEIVSRETIEGQSKNIFAIGTNTKSLQL